MILLHYKTNQRGIDQFLRKGLRAITCRKGLIKGIFKQIEVFQLPDGHEVPAFQFDVERLGRSWSA